MQLTKAVPLVIPPQVEAFAAQEGVSSHLPAVLKMTQRIFPNAQIRLVLDEDPEIADDRHIALEVKAEDMKVSEALDARYQWHRDLFANCPAPLVCVFRLGLEIGS
jgi:hypothetical protein